MKTLTIILALTLGLTSAHARVGETAPEVEHRYGKPTGEKSSFGNVSREYGYRGFRVLVSFRKGRSAAESYRKIPPAPFLPSEISALLRANAGGSKWQQRPKGSHSALVFYQTADHHFAIHDTVRHTLQFSREVSGSR